MAEATKTETATPKAGGKPDWAKNRADGDGNGDKGRTRKRRRWPIILVLALIAAGGYGLIASRSAPTDKDASAMPAAVTMQVNADEREVVAPRILRRTVKVIGTLDPSRSTQLSSQTSGRVEDVNAQPGDAVAEGAVLAQVDVETLTLDRDLARSNAEATKAQMVLAEAQLERVQALVTRGVTTASNLDEAQSNLAGLRANLDAQEDQISAAELRLRNATLRAPFDGIVSERNVEPGQYVAIGTPLMTVVDLSTVEMQANAAVGAGSLLKPGQSVTVRVDGIPGRSFDGTVARINPVAEAETRTIPVYVTIDNAEGLLLGGMFATGQVVVEEAEDALAVPASALREDAQGQHVLRVEDGKLVRQPVTTAGDWTGRLTQISEGLAPGQIVVTAPLNELNPGDAVELVEN